MDSYELWKEHWYSVAKDIQDDTTKANCYSYDSASPWECKASQRMSRCSTAKNYITNNYSYRVASE